MELMYKFIWTVFRPQISIDCVSWSHCVFEVIILSCNLLAEVTSIWAEHQAHLIDGNFYMKDLCNMLDVSN